MSEQDAIEEMQNRCYIGDDYEVNHLNADKILCSFLRSLGYNKLVDEYEHIDKEYA